MRFSPTLAPKHLSGLACESEQQHVVILVRNKGLRQLDKNMWYSWYEMRRKRMGWTDRVRAAVRDGRADDPRAVHAHDLHRHVDSRAERHSRVDSGCAHKTCYIDTTNVCWHGDCPFTAREGRRSRAYGLYRVSLTTRQQRLQQGGARGGILVHTRILDYSVLACRRHDGAVRLISQREP